MRRCARLHADEAGRKIGEEADDLCAPKLAPDEDGAVTADRVHLEIVLRQIQSDGNNLLLRLPTPRAFFDRYESKRDSPLG